MYTTCFSLPPFSCLTGDDPPCSEGKIRRPRVVSLVKSVHDVGNVWIKIGTPDSRFATDNGLGSVQNYIEGKNSTPF